MGRRIRTATGIALAAAALVATGDTVAAQPATCPPADVACKLREGLEGVLAPIVAPPATTPPATTSPGTSPGSTAAPLLGPASVAASTGEAGAPADLAAPPARVPSVPVGQALELPPLTIPDFGAPVDTGPVDRVARPVRSEVGDALTGLARPPAPGGGDPARALAVAVGVPVVLVGVSVAARRRLSGAG